MLACGHSYLDGNDEEEDYHLHIVVTPPKEGWVVVASVSTIYRFADKTVVVKAGEHPWIKHESYVVYRFAKLQEVAEIEARLAMLPKMIKQSCNEALLRRIQQGILESEETENGVKHFYREILSDRA